MDFPIHCLREVPFRGREAMGIMRKIIKGSTMKRLSVTFLLVFALGGPSMVAMAQDPFADEALQVDRTGTQETPGQAPAPTAAPDKEKGKTPPLPEFADLSPTARQALQGLRAVSTVDGRATVLKGEQAYEYYRVRQPKLLQAWLKLDARLGGSRLASAQRFFLGDGFASFDLGNGRFLSFDRKDFGRASVFDYGKLHPEERRILGETSMEVTQDGKKLKLSGPELFGFLALRDPRALLGFLNVCAKLRSPAFTFSDGGTPRTALSFLHGVTYVASDRFRADVDPRLKDLVAQSDRFSGVPGHGAHFPDSFKQKDCLKAGGQMSFSADGTHVEPDIDMFNIAAGNPFKKVAGALGHFGEVVTPGKTDPFKIHGMLKGQKEPCSAQVLEVSDHRREIQDQFDR